MTGQPTLRRKLLRDIKRSWALFAALVVAVTLGLGMYAAMNNSYRNLSESYDNAFAQLSRICSSRSRRPRRSPRMPRERPVSRTSAPACRPICR